MVAGNEYTAFIALQPKFGYHFNENPGYALVQVNGKDAQGEIYKNEENPGTGYLEGAFIVSAPLTAEHVWDAGKVTTKPTLTKTGVRTFTCKGCGEKRTETVAKLKANTLTVKAKTASVKYSKLKKKTRTVNVNKVLTVSNAKGTVTYTKISGKKKITVDTKTGKVTIKKGLKKGTYKIKVKVTAAGTTTYGAKTVTKTFKIRVK